MQGAFGLPAAAPSRALLLSLCAWLDRLPLSRPKRHLARDFSDGVLVAEIVKHFHPRLVDLHNYIPACNTDQKLSNWSLLNRKVFHKLHFYVSEADIRKVVANVPGAIEPILCALREKDPELSRVDAEQPWAEMPTHVHTGLPRSLGSSRVKTLHSQRALGKRDRRACVRGDPAKGGWEHPARVQQLLEDREQTLAILQQIVQILQMKVLRLEHLVQLKDQRIEELMRAGPGE